MGSRRAIASDGIKGADGMLPSRRSNMTLRTWIFALIRRAMGGERVLITRHGRPVAYLDSAELQHLHFGGNFGKPRLKPLLRRATCGAYLRVLGVDRGAER
jgi:prevent-host-death family protein